MKSLFVSAHHVTSRVRARSLNSSSILSRATISPMKWSLPARSAWANASRVFALPLTTNSILFHPQRSIRF